MRKRMIVRTRRGKGGKKGMVKAIHGLYTLLWPGAREQLRMMIRLQRRPSAI